MTLYDPEALPRNISESASSHPWGGYQVFMCAQLLSHIQLFATLWTVAHQAPLSLEFSRQEYWNGLPCPPPGDLPNPGIKLESPVFPALQVFLYH